MRAVTSSKYKKSLLPVLVHIEEHLEEPLRLDELAALAGFSPFHFHRIFQHVTGEAPKEYLRRQRLERAVYRLKASPDSVLRIALDAGFSTHETFTRAFTRQFDMSPSDFRAVLNAYRKCVDEELGTYTFPGFSDDSPLKLRFDHNKQAVTIEKVAGQHLIFKRYLGYEELLQPQQSFTDLWQDLFEFADAQGLDYSKDRLIGIAHDDPYVTDEAKFRFDACLPLSGPVAASHPIGYRTLPPSLCVARRHTGGLEEIAKTYALIGVEWLPTDEHCLRAAPPFEIYHCQEIAGQWEHIYTDAYVALEPNKSK